jgi:cell division protease FtsH
MDRHVEVGLPNQLGRLAILKVHSRHIRCHEQEVDWNLLAKHTQNFSGAELRTVVNEAAMLAVRQRGSEVLQHHLVQAIQKIQLMKAAMRGASSVPHGMLIR